MTRRILCLGGASQIGVAICAEYCRREPADVVLAGRAGSPHRAEALAQMERAGAASVTWIDFDATDVASHPAVLEWGEGFDVAVVAFGILGDSDVWADHEATCEMAATNVAGAFSVGSLVATRMRDQGHGLIIALSSVAGERVRRSNFVYGATKAAVDGFYLQLGAAVASAGVHVLVVRPGAVIGRMTAGRRIPLSVTPDRVARSVWRAVERGRRTVRVPAIFTPIMALFRLAPRWVAERT